jgi:two-component system sensor histidine kinase BarA
LLLQMLSERSRMIRMPLKTIRSKILALIAATIVLAQAIIASLSVWQEASRYGAQKQETLNATAQVLASAAAPAVAAGDASAAYAAIRAMGRISGVAYVSITGKDGRNFVEIGVTDRLDGDLTVEGGGPPIPVLELIASRTIELVVPVVNGGVELGKLHLVAGTSDLLPRLWAAIETTILGGFAGLLVAFAVALRLQRGITEPIRRLTSIMRRVRESHDYSVSMPPGGKDETGVLADGFNAMLGDIRARDQAIARHMEELEQEVADRTRDYREAAAEAQSANSAKSEFLATMSHEIRTPMNGILVMAELLAACELPEKARRHADVIAKSGQSLLAIINDILDMSKIEAGRLEVEKLDVDPEDAAETVLRLFAERARSKGVDLCARILVRPGTQIQADPVRLGQVLSNLVNNALKFTEKGSVTLEVAQDPAEAKRVRFAVIDTGIGIEADKLDAIFDAFAQADQTTARRFGGTGLGLAIGKRLVAAMGGDLAVESEPDRGSTFFFSLPLAAAASPAPEALWKGDASRRKAAICLPGVATRSSALLYLTEMGFDAVSCDEAERVAACRDAKLLLVAADLLRSRGRPDMLDNGTVIALADAGSQGDELVEAGTADHILRHPLSRLELREIVHALDAGGLARREAKAPKRDALPSFAGARILVADDSAVNREVAQEALSRFGVEPVLVESGRQAVEALRARAFDLVLMDGSMPDLDGFAATRLIREIERTEARGRTPIIALTAHVVGAGADAWVQAGMDGILHKPYTLAKLADCLSQYLGAGDRSRASEGEGGPSSEPPATRLLDPSVLAGLREMSGGATHLVERVARLYREHAPLRIAELREAIERSHFKGVATAAHALKSMSLNIGAQAVAQAAARLEREANGDQALVTPQVIEELGSLTEQTCAELSQEAA